ncbi:translocon-associated protein subunit delta [Cimex lectularius]|uniref:Translocon-associated protein subunit delta n=1 Tax=Cimex lectularius TaxID=79782 RepID=A0A8I6RKW6_CIMLE|nr:translocon-associated protein subunit delta [Cimex lectularius]
MYKILVLIALYGVAYGSATCTNPEVTATSYTTKDGTVITNVAFVAEFTLKCSNGASDLPLYAEINGKTFPAVQFDKDHYQVSWVDEISKARSGTYTISLYDEEGYALLRKALRNAEAPSKVSPLFKVELFHPGTYQGPWLNSEFLAVTLSVSVWYLAFSAKSKLLL